MMAGRNISCSHVAFTSTRVMGTCAVAGQAVGTAAALCVREAAAPRRIFEDKKLLAKLQQELLRDDQTIKNRTNKDPLDLARQARVTGSDQHAAAPAECVRELTLTASDSINQGIIRAAQPETARDYTVSARRPGRTEYETLAAVSANHQRLRRHRFEPVEAEALRIHITATNGDDYARVFEVRCYG